MLDTAYFIIYDKAKAICIFELLVVCLLYSLEHLGL